MQYKYTEFWLNRLDIKNNKGMVKKNKNLIHSDKGQYKWALICILAI